VSVYKRKSGRYAVLIDLDLDARGKRRRKSLGTYRTHKEAERAERDALSARDRGIDVVPSHVTLDGLFRRYMFDAEARRLSGTTLHGYEQIWKRVAPLASIPVTKLRGRADFRGSTAKQGSVVSLISRSFCQCKGPRVQRAMHVG